jgi:tRNA(Arg) A34 adenosine deaminase TadA
MNNDTDRYMFFAIEEAKIAMSNGDWPFGSVVIKNGEVVGKGHVKDKSGGDVTEHAELVAIREACRNLKSNNLKDCSIYCTNEPCLMCASGIFQANISKVIIGASRDDLTQLLRPRRLRIEEIAEDEGYKIEIKRGVSKDQILELFKDVKNNTINL